MSGKYDDLLYLPHHESVRHPRMSPEDRAAQFAPFAALTGLDAQMQEAARLTDGKILLSEEHKLQIHDLLQEMHSRISQGITAEITYFVEDIRKAGGAYRTVRGVLQKVDPISRSILLKDGTLIPMDDLLSVREC